MYELKKSVLEKYLEDTENVNEEVEYSWELETVLGMPSPYI